MIHTVFHNYKDDELVRYALSAIHHPAVVEICQRISLVDFEISEHDQFSDLEEELAQANATIDELTTEISDLEDEISDHLRKIESLEEALEEEHVLSN